MENLHIRDILLQFEGNDLSKYGLFPLFAWYLVDYVELLKRLKPLTVKRKRNNKKPIKRRKPKFTEIYNHKCKKKSPSSRIFLHSLLPLKNIRIH